MKKTKSDPFWRLCVDLASVCVDAKSWKFSATCGLAHADANLCMRRLKLLFFRKKNCFRPLNTFRTSDFDSVKSPGLRIQQTTIFSPLQSHSTHFPFLKYLKHNSINVSKFQTRSKPHENAQTNIPD
jgi:hypothetical protein